jgi:hypothetical protein
VLKQAWDTAGNRGDLALGDSAGVMCALYVEVLPLVLHNGTLFREGVFKEVIKVK